MIKDLAIQGNSLNSQILPFILNLLLSLGLSALLALIYAKKGRSLSNRSDFSQNFVLLTMTTMLIITIVKSSLALSLGLVGALSIVRFRTAIKEPEELTYIFISIAIGLGLGANQTYITLAGFTIISLTILLRNRSSNKSNSESMNLIINHPMNNSFDFEKVVNIVSENSRSVMLRRFNQEDEYIESTLTVQVLFFSQLLTIRDKLTNIYPKIAIHFIDNTGIISE